LQAADPLEFQKLWQRGFDYPSAPAPLATDLDLDRRYDIVMVNIKHEVAAINIETGKLLWSRDLGDFNLLTPVAGHFLGNNRINLVVPTSNGQIFVLDGPTGEILTQVNCGFPLTLPPVVFPWTTEDAATPYREGLLLYDAGGQVTGFLINPRHGLDQIFAYATEGILNVAPAVGPTGLDAPPPHISFVTISGQVTVFAPRANPIAGATLSLANLPKCDLGLTLADLKGDSFNDLLVADINGYLHALAVQGGKLVPVWTEVVDGKTQPAEQTSIINKPRYTPVSIDVDGDKRDDILIPRPKGFMLMNGATGHSLWDPKSAIPGEYAHDNNISSPPAVIRAADGNAYCVFSDELGLCLLRLKDRVLAGRFSIGRMGTIPPLAGPLSGDDKLEAFTRTSTDGAGYLFDLGLQMKSSAPPWLGLGSGPSRMNGEARAYHAYVTAQHQRLSRHMEDVLANARQFASQKNWHDALLAVNEVLSTSPHFREALKVKKYYYFRDNLWWLLLAAIAGVGLAGFGFYHGGRYTEAAVRQSLARRAQKQGDHEKAIRLLYSLCMKFPKNRRYIRQLADIYIREKRFTAESAPIFQRARLIAPEEDKYLKALATAYSSIPRHDETAAVVYSEMAQISKKPGPWFFILGEALQAIDRPREALEAFRQTILHQHEDPDLPDHMTDLYIQLGITSPDILPTLDRVLESRREDRGFLRTYCQACVEARRYDEMAATLAQSLLEQDPQASAAHIILATRMLQSGLHKDAMRHAQNILQVNPSDSIGLRLLGACYAAEHRLDETAMKIFGMALNANPDAPEILLAVSHGYVQSGRTDDEARDIYKKAIVHAPQDESILVQLAKIASKDTDDDLTIRAIEPLLELGRRDREMILQLANAYCRQGIVEDKAERIYAEALKMQPDHATIQDNLAAIFLRKQQCDHEAAKIFESVLGRNPERIDIGMQLLRCYQHAEAPERMLELGQRLLEIDPSNVNIQKLMGAASEKSDQMEAAIARYEQVLASNPNDPETICALASLYGRRRRSDNPAIEAYNKAIQLKPNEPDFYLSAARAYARRNAWDSVIQVIKHLLTQAPAQIAAAIDLMEKLAEGSPRELKLRWYLIDTLIFDGRLRDARRHLMEVLRIDPKQNEIALIAFDKILEKNPKDAASHLERGKILLTLDRERDARQAMEQAHRFHPENDEIARNLLTLYQGMLTKRDSAEVRFQLGRLAMRLDKLDLAISCFQQTSRDYRWEAESVRHLARCFMAKGMLDLALQELKRLPMENDVKEQLYELGQRYEAVHDIQGAREVYKIIFAADITFKDVKGKLETLQDAGDHAFHAERTAIINSLSEEAKQRYELVQELGRGAMGIVYKAKDNELDEMVALKILPDSLIRNQEAVRRFRQEARNARKLSHPHIVRIHDIGEEMGRKYISMEFVQGSDLKQKLRQNGRKLPIDVVVRYAREMCEAMAYAHSIGIVHRDIKPANLMLTKDDQIKVTDFGIAKMVEQTQAPDATQAGAIIGTPLYMSPEQVKGAAVDHRADIYSMGVVFYEMLTGRPPFTEGDLSYQHLFVEPKPLPKEVPESFAALTLKCLAKDPAARPQSATEIMDVLKGIKV
jgi:tetratricopeptide (TPR) repeat protein